MHVHSNYKYDNVTVCYSQNLNENVSPLITSGNLWTPDGTNSIPLRYEGGTKMG